VTPGNGSIASRKVIKSENWWAQRRWNANTLPQMKGVVAIAGMSIRQTLLRLVPRFEACNLTVINFVVNDEIFYKS